METNNKNKFIVVSYALYDVTNGDNGEEMPSSAQPTSVRSSSSAVWALPCQLSKRRW